MFRIYLNFINEISSYSKLLNINRVTLKTGINSMECLNGKVYLLISLLNKMENLFI